MRSFVFALWASFLVYGYQAWIASDNESRQLRAYVFGDYGHLYRNLTKGSRPVIKLAVIDRGVTPAKNLSAFGVLKVAPYPLPNYDFLMDQVEFAANITSIPGDFKTGGWGHANVCAND